MIPPGLWFKADNGLAEELKSEDSRRRVNGGEQHVKMHRRARRVEESRKSGWSQGKEKQR